MNEVAVQPKKDNSIKALLARDDVKARFAEMLGKKANAFLTSVMTAVQQNQNLAKADPTSIMFAAATAASLDLPVTPSLGYAYLVPYNTKQNDGSFIQMCQFQIGYKGLIQLCQRTSMFKRINAVEVYEGQIVDENPLTGNTYNWAAKTSNKVVGYVAMFELTNGYSHELYMTREQVQAHAGRYSKTHKNKYGVWQTNELEMSIKTVLKLLLGRYAPMSVDYIQRAITNDQAIIKDWDGGEIEYVDNTPAEIDPTLQLETLQAMFDEKSELISEEDKPFIEAIIANQEEASYAKAIKVLSAL